jgi:hypothetical protein
MLWQVLALLKKYQQKNKTVFIPDSDFYPSRIPDPTTAPKEGGGGGFFLVLPFFFAT